MNKIVIRRKKDAAEQDPVWVGADNAGKPADYEYRAMKSSLEGCDSYAVRFKLASMYGEALRTDGKPQWILELALLYGAMVVGAKRTGKPLSPMEYKRYALYRSLDVEAAKLDSDVYKYMECNLKGGASTMAKKNGSKKESRVTASSVLIKVLARASVPTDDVIIAEVRSETGSTKFDEKQLAWYKWKFRQGKLKGQDGKQHTIEQKAAHAKKEKAGKPAKRRVVVKRKAVAA